MLTRCRRLYETAKMDPHLKVLKSIRRELRALRRELAARSPTAPIPAPPPPPVQFEAPPTTRHAQFKKMAHGGWGIAVYGGPEPEIGVTIEVTKKDGEVCHVTVAEVVDNPTPEYWLCDIEKTSAPRKSAMFISTRPAMFCPMPSEVIRELSLERDPEDMY